MLEGGNSTRLRAIRADLPSTLSWRLDVPQGMELETHFSFAPEKLDALAGASCEARVEAAGGTSPPRVLVRQRLEPRAGWQVLRADLAAYGAQAIEVRLGASCTPRDRGHALRGAAQWGVPVMYRPGQGLNLLLITIDTLRADHLRAYGYPRETSPSIDHLARRGILFRNAETVQSATWPALTSLHSSLYPSAHGVISNGRNPPQGLVTLASLLDARGYSCSAFVTNMKRATHPGFSRIFAPLGEQVAADRKAAQAAARQLRLETRRPFFIWLHLIGPHGDYDPPPPFDRAFTRPGASALEASIAALARARARNTSLAPDDVAHVVGLYDGEILWVDSLVGSVLAALGEAGLERNTLVALTADHGEDLYEHHRHFFHSPSMYASSLRVPLILSLPGVLPTGETSGHLASIVDVAPTLLSLLGLPRPAGFQGVDLLSGRSLPREPARTRLFSETHGSIYAARTAEWRLIFNPERLQPEARGGPYPFEAEELYDRRSDPAEQRNLAAARPDIVQGLTREILEFKRLKLEPTAPMPEESDAETREELRALGYID
ncbi:MAG TPA: sulfatase [Vicinamibacteria bacterium]|nr:sulfatase [Vicinamibacteria bacterium]